jgi:uncharacterized HAD superfamily protein
MALKRLFCDIDGTLTNETEGHDYPNRTPNLETIRELNYIYSSGKYNLTLWTSRFEVDREDTEIWLQRHGVDYDSIIFGKPKFDIYIGDEELLHVANFLMLCKRGMEW